MRKVLSCYRESTFDRSGRCDRARKEGAIGAYPEGRCNRGRCNRGRRNGGRYNGGGATEAGTIEGGAIEAPAVETSMDQRAAMQRRHGTGRCNYSPGWSWPFHQDAPS